LINYAEDQYGATLQPTPADTFPDTITCPDGTSHGNLTFGSLQTGPPVPSSAPVGAGTFSGTGNISLPNVTGTYTWQFDADVP
jgi:hypothetical protein